jgi:diguanylate cyclase (GGDEF)-like protein/PAS domain S-box-containing protein
VTIPILIYVVFERGPAIATLSVILTAFITTAFTVHGHGPVAAITKLGPLGQSVYLQVYIAIVLVTVYPIGRALHKQRSLQRLYTLLADNTRDVITRRTIDGVRTYCSPSVFEVLGWTQEEMVTMPTSQLVHPDDLEQHAAVIQELSAGKPSAVLTFRLRTVAGPYLWMEGHFRMLRDPRTDMPTEILSTSRDITQRIAAEEGLQAAYRKLELLASTDALTGMANRRTFDETLEREWRRATRERTPVALLMMDVDNFKAYNDALGHPAGDECLRRIAQCLGEIVQRPGDLSARYGGEEFVILLPITDEAGALHIARRITEALANLAIPHPANGAADRVTLSLGIASLVPVPGDNPESLVGAADRALYDAKRKGRDRIEIAWPEGEMPANDFPESLVGRA